MRYPTDNTYVSSPYGARTLPGGVANFHHGADFPRPSGGNLYAVSDYKVIANTWREAGGWTVAIQLPDGVVAWYQHMKSQSPLKVGNSGKEGDVVGVMGQTGSMVWGVHLHFELRRNGVSFDPEPYLRTGTAASGGSKPLPNPKPEVPVIEQEEDEEMAGSSGFYYTKDDTIVYLIVNNDRGTYHEYSNGKGNGPMPSAYNNAIAAAYRTGNFASITAGHAEGIKRQNKPSEN